MDWKHTIAALSGAAAIAGYCWYNEGKLYSRTAPVIDGKTVEYNGVVVTDQRVLVPGEVLGDRHKNSVYNIGNNAHQHGVFVWNNGRLASLEDITKKALDEPAHPTTNVTNASAGSTSATTSTTK